MPINQFSYVGKISGSDLSALFLGTDLGNVVEISISRSVTLSWDVGILNVTNSFGRDGQVCYQVTVTEYSLMWSAVINETVTKVTKPAPIVNKIGEIVTDVGKVITGIGGSLLTWAGIVALSPGLPAAPIGAAGGTIMTGIGGIAIGVGEALQWMTEEKVDSWTTTYKEYGDEPFTHTNYTKIECPPECDYNVIDVPNPVPTYEFLKSECISKVGNDLANSGLLHPPE